MKGHTMDERVKELLRWSESFREAMDELRAAAGMNVEPRLTPQHAADLVHGMEMMSKTMIRSLFQ